MDILLILMKKISSCLLCNVLLSFVNLKKIIQLFHQFHLDVFNSVFQINIFCLNKPK